jgi:hypothetical protein
MGLVALVFAAKVFGFFLDTTTELAPDHSDRDFLICASVAGAGALASAGFMFRLARGLVLWRRLGMSFSAAFLGLLAFFAVGLRVRQHH